MQKKEYIIVILLIFSLSRIFAAPCGDVNSSGVIDIVDALITAQYYVGLNPAGFDPGAADVSGDGATNIIDALLIAQYYVGLIDTLEGCEANGVTIQENTTGFCGVDGSVDSNHAGYSGSGFANADNVFGSGVDWSITGDPGSYTLHWRFANGSTDNRTGVLSSNSVTVSTIDFNPTGGWSTWETTSVTLNLEGGYNALRLEANQDGGLANIDSIEITGPNVAVTSCRGSAGTSSGTSNTIIAQPIPDRTVAFSSSDTGVSKPIIWGLDTAWLSEANIRRGVAFMGADRVDLVRASFTPTSPLVNGDLQDVEAGRLNNRLDLIDLTGPNTQVTLNCDHPSVDSWFKDANGVGIATRWAQLMDVTARRVQERGRTVVTIAPFNEPDYTVTGQGTIEDFYNIAGALQQNSRFNNIRISGGNTLNTDQALPWYEGLKNRLQEGNTHQLAGSFDNYAGFFEAVRANGDHATNDELHNVMEAMVGVEYGLQTGIWWGTAELARGEFVKASDGQRLGYAEHRSNWTAASVYRSPNGKVQAFGGSSERQAVTTTYRFVSQDRDVFYDGYGPQREYTMVIPGGTGYQDGQTNAERVVNITWGDDIQLPINGRYVLVNRNSGKVLEAADGDAKDGANIQQGGYTGATHQQWDVTPVHERIGGDFSYFQLTAVHSGKALDVFDFSLDNGGNVVQWGKTDSSNQQWYMTYAGDGWFYICSRLSAKCLDVADNSVSAGANIHQWEIVGGTNQQWRLLPIAAPIEFDSPGAPSGLVTTANAVSIRLSWTASPESDVTGYTVFRSNSAGGPYDTIARNVTTTSFVDHTVNAGMSTGTDGRYYYAVKAVDESLNRSDYSVSASGAPTGNRDLVVHLTFDEDTLDSSRNLNHSASFGEITYGSARVGPGAITLNGTNNFVQLPANVASHQEITIAAWIYWNGGDAWQRVFDFGNSQSEYIFLTPSSWAGVLRFAINNGDGEQVLDAPALPMGQWSHVAVTLGISGARLYVNGTLENEDNSVTASPMEFKPVLNYIGRSQFPDPLFNGRIDDFRVYNYALSAAELTQILSE